MSASFHPRLLFILSLAVISIAGLHVRPRVEGDEGKPDADGLVPGRACWCRGQFLKDNSGLSEAKEGEAMLEEADAIVEEPVVNNEDLLEAIWGQSFVDNQAIIDSICETPPAPVDATPPAPVEAPVEETATPAAPVEAPVQETAAPAAPAAPATRVDADAAKKCRSDIRKSKLTVLKLCA
ncbi:hypothetical protein V2A60_008314 [Cordyceps javanica]